MRRLFAVVILAAAVSAGSVSAQVPAGGAFRVDVPDPYWQWVDSPSVASAANGDFVLSWVCFRYNHNCWIVPGRQYEASGASRGEPFSIAIPGYLDGVSAASDSAGRFVIVWNDYETRRVSAALFDASGHQRSEFLVNTSPVGMEAAPAAAFDGAGNFVVAWIANGATKEVFAQRFDASGTPRGSELHVNSHPGGVGSFWPVPAVAADASGNFLVVWNTTGPAGSPDSMHDIYGQFFDSTGARRGDEFRVNTWTTGDQVYPSVAAEPAGSFVVAWESGAYRPPPPPDPQDGSGPGIFAQRYDASGAPAGLEFRVNTYTTGHQSRPTVASDAAGNFVVAWENRWGITAQRFERAGMPRDAEFWVSKSTGSQWNPSVASDAAGNLVFAWSASYDGGIYARRFGGLQPAALVVDASASSGSDGNGVLEPGESTVVVAPSWRNVNGLTQAFDGIGLGLDGPPASGVSYTLTDAAGAYGTVANGATAVCTDCYELGVTFGGSRPATHWDATFTERLTPDAMGQTKPWPLHVGESFSDMPRTSGYYRFVETLLHKGVTSGCGAASYCPTSPVTREQVSVFALIAKEGAGYLPAPCGVPVFGDVPASSSICRYVEELSRRGVVSGCGGGNYCPTAAVTREQMPVFVLKTLDPALDPPACTTPPFGDVPATSPFCRWIAELARRGIAGGCGGGNYCPSDPVTREQMAVFIAVTFGLSLYGP